MVLQKDLGSPDFGAPDIGGTWDNLTRLNTVAMFPVTAYFNEVDLDLIFISQ